jgi:hypothetical protein
VSRNGDVNDLATVRPLLTLEEFFAGNTRTGSICCNCTPTPEPAEMFAVLKQVRARSDVADVRVQITMFDDPEWPFTDTVWVVTSARADQVKAWFAEAIRPDETWNGWTAGVKFEPLAIAAGMSPVACWWD